MAAAKWVMFAVIGNADGKTRGNADGKTRKPKARAMMKSVVEVRRIGIYDSENDCIAAAKVSDTVFDNPYVAFECIYFRLPEPRS